MSAPIIWIFLPGLAALVLFALRRWERTIHIAGVLLVLFLVLLAWRLPIGEPLSLGLPGVAPVEIGDTFTILGRRLVLDNSLRPVLVLLYLMVALWLGGAYSAGVRRFFVPLVIALAALVVATLAVRPVLYAALFMELIALVCVPVLSPPGQPVRRGVLRFLTFQTMGMCLVLLADFLLGLIQAKPDGGALAAPDTFEITLGFTALLGLGFALTAAIFPFHTWVPMLAEDSHPYAAAFVFFLVPTTVAFIGLDYLGQYTSLEVYPAIQVTLRAAGVLTCMVGGAWAALENRLGRILGFAALTQIGMGLLAISMGSQAGPDSPLLGIYFAQLVPQVIGLALWALALSTLRQHQPDLSFRKVRGLAQRLPIVTMSLVLANFSLAGLPLLASFPGNVALWTALTRASLPSALLSLVGSASLFTAGIRTLAVLVTQPVQENWSVSEGNLQATLLIVGMLLLITIGLTPQWFLPAMAQISVPFFSR